MIKVKAFRKTGELNEKDSVLYEVVYPDLPQIILPSSIGNTIHLKNFQGSNEIELNFSPDPENNPYKLIEFSITNSIKGIFSLVSYGNFLSPQQINFIQNRTTGVSFYVINAKFKDPQGKIHLASPIEYFVEY